MEVLRRHSTNYGAVQRVERLTRHLKQQRKDRSADTSQRASYQPRKLSQRLPDETVAAMLAAYQAGATTREVGERFGLAHSTINKLLRRHGVMARRRSPSAGEVWRAIELYEAGLSTRVIAGHLGFGASTVTRALVRAGVTMRPRFGQ